MLDDFKPVYPNEERLWQLFLRVQDAAPSIPTSHAIHTRVQIAYNLLQEYENAVTLLRQKGLTKEEPRKKAESIQDLYLPGRVMNMLKEGNITTLDQLCAQRDSDLLRFPSLGRKAVNTIKEALADHGMQLRQ